MQTLQKQSEGIVWLKLNEQSVQKLRQMFPPSFPNEFYHHVTLAFGAQKSLFEDVIGTTASVLAYAYAKNNHVEAVRVHTEGLPDTYGVPHVTLSTQKDIKPFASVMMLQSDHHEKPIDHIELGGTVEFVQIAE